MRSVVRLRHSLSAAHAFGPLNLEPVSGYTRYALHKGLRQCTFRISHVSYHMTELATEIAKNLASEISRGRWGAKKRLSHQI